MTDPAPAIIRILQAYSRSTGMAACVHDVYQLGGLPNRWREHWNQPCREVKHRHQADCARFCGGEVHRALEGRPNGRIHRCPFGFSDIAVPIARDGRMLGVLFSGTFWVRRSPPPHPALPLLRDARSREDRRILLQATATQLADLLAPDATSAGHRDRRQDILAHLHRNLPNPIRLRDVAERIGLSESRTGHVIRELFGTTFPSLVLSVRLTEAARLLTITDETAAQIGSSLAFCDQSHFTRTFSRRYGMSPMAYRRRHRAESCG
jgi:AraC-like DNA-binding protein